MIFSAMRVFSSLLSIPIAMGMVRLQRRPDIHRAIALKDFQIVVLKMVGTLSRTHGSPPRCYRREHRDGISQPPVPVVAFPVIGHWSTVATETRINSASATWRWCRMAGSKGVSGSLYSPLFWLQ